MKKFRYKILLMLALFGMVSNAVATSYMYLPTTDGKVLIVDTEKCQQDENNNPIISAEMCEVEKDFPVGPDVIQSSSIDLDEVRLLINYEDNAVFITNANTNVLEAGLKVIESIGSTSIIGRFFRLNISGRGSGIIITPHYWRRGNTIPRVEGFYTGNECSEKAPCQEEYPSDELVIFTAMPDQWSTFNKWECNEKEADTYDCTATFDLIPLHTLGSSALNVPVEASLNSVLTAGIFEADNPLPMENTDVEVSSTTPLSIRGIITVDPKHVGQEADIVVVAGYTPVGSEKPLFFARDGAIDIESWDGQKRLPGFKKNVSLQETEQVELYSGPPLLEGTWVMYFGYRLDDGTLVFNVESIKIKSE